MDERTGASSDATEEAFEVRGVVKWFDAVKGYGFIIPVDGSDDILLHHSCLKEAGHEVAREGATVVCKAVRRSNQSLPSEFAAGNLPNECSDSVCGSSPAGKSSWPATSVRP